jgi:adenylate kinase family enzyme
MSFISGIIIYVPMRISIIGLPGSGKTTLAERISTKLSIPHIQIDRFWFESGGPAVTYYTPKEELERVRAKVREKTLAAIATDSWVSDGFYSRLQPEIADRADEIIFLDIPLWRRLLNHAMRLMNPNRHKELTMWDEIRFFSEIVRRTFRHGPKLRKFVAERKHKITILSSRKEIQDHLGSLGERA